ncbi:MAG TPA: anti-sigma factor antagonist [Streptomyces sp.]|nr:anti-sigma factor antagonist [Streptomyces sp.]
MHRGSPHSFPADEAGAVPEEESHLTPQPTRHVAAYRTNGCTVLELRGDMDIVTALRITPHVDAATASVRPRIVIDLTPVTFLDASGLTLLCRAYRRTCEQGGSLSMVRGRPRIMRILEITGLDSRFRPVATLAEALSFHDSPT